MLDFRLFVVKARNFTNPVSKLQLHKYSCFFFFSFFFLVSSKDNIRVSSHRTSEEIPICKDVFPRYTQ